MGGRVVALVGLALCGVSLPAKAASELAVSVRATPEVPGVVGLTVVTNALHWASFTEHDVVDARALDAAEALRLQSCAADPACLSSVFSSLGVHFALSAAVVPDGSGFLIAVKLLDTSVGAVIAAELANSSATQVDAALAVALRKLFAQA